MLPPVQQTTRDTHTAGPRPRLASKSVIITGGSGGIGAAAGALFAREGAQVLLVDLDEARLKEAVQACESPNVTYAVADVADPADTARFVDLAVQRHGRLDVLFANAGIEGKVAPLAELALADFERVMAVNVRGVLLGIQRAIPAMIAGGGGSIVVTSSVAGFIGSPGLVPYVTSKHALIGLVRAAALELAPQGIRVNSVHPGPIDNRMMRSLEGQISADHPEAVKSGFEQRVPLGRYGRNEEIAALALFLASDEASYCTGATFVADGGYLCQ